MSMISPVQSRDHESNPMGKEVKLRWEGFDGNSFESGVKSEVVTNAESDDYEKDGLTSE